MDKNQLTGIILAGGLSSRMGCDKGLLPYKGKLLVEYAIDLLKPYCAEILISSNNNEYKQFGFRLVADIYKKKGPLGGIHAALIASKTKHSVFLSCDMPHLNSEAVEQLIRKSDPNALGCIPKYGDKLEPMFGIYSKQLLPEIEERLQYERLKMKSLILEQPIKYVDFQKLTQKYENLFSNINHPNDLH